MHSDHRQDIGVLFLQLPQLRKYVHAVNSAVGPEVEDYESAFEIGHADRRDGVDPLEFFGEPWSVDRSYVSFRQCLALRAAALVILREFYSDTNTG
jgi:hypothetical protein